MPVYKSSKALYSSLRATFGQIQQDSPDNLEGLKGLMASRMVIRLVCTRPAAEVILNGRERPFQVIYGAYSLRADLTVELAADSLHHILLDELSIKKAVADGSIKLRGPVWKLKVLADLIQAARVYYPDVVRKQIRA